MLYTGVLMSNVSLEVKRKVVWTTLYEYELCKGCGEPCNECGERAIVPKLQNKLYECCQGCVEAKQKEVMMKTGASRVVPMKRKKTKEEIDRDAKTKAKAKVQAEQAKARKKAKALVLADQTKAPKNYENSPFLRLND